MPVYTIGDPLSPASSGINAVKVAAGVAYNGESINLTTQEAATLSQVVELTYGSVTDTPQSGYVRYPATAIAQNQRIL